jgi:predicted amidophosphoribosyltransferase
VADQSSSSGMVEDHRVSVPGRRRHGWGWLAEISDALVSVVFPSGCRVCERLLTTASRVPLCEECLSSFERVPIIICGVCGRPLPGLARKEGEPLLCPACQEKTYTFDRARSFAVYADTVVRAILLLKFERIEPLGAWFSERLAEIVNADSGQLSADVVVPVPLHREREKKRGYNQVNLQTPGKKAQITAQNRTAGADPGTPRQASAEFGGTLGVRAWRFCHTSRQPS